jgi:hypothetical protein
VGLVLVGAARKHAQLSADRPFHGITDEPKLHSYARLEWVQGMGEAVRHCLESTQARVLVQGGQASLAYYAHFPIAIESYGLTEAQVAHAALKNRGRPGHEKFVDAKYIYEHEVNFRIYYRPMRHLPRFAVFGIPGPKGVITGEILTYKRELMEQLKSCPGVQFLDFPRWLRESYIPDSVPNELPGRLVREFRYFKRFYFDHNADSEGLLSYLRAALAARGIRDIPEEPIPEGEDTGQADWSPSAHLVR